MNQVFPRVSVITPVYNDAARLARLLESLDNLRRPGPVEVIVVDDCSTDAAASVVQAWQGVARDFEKKYVRLEANSGPAAARNAGLRMASGDVAAFTDSDCVVDEHWLEQLVLPLAQAPNLAGTGGAVRPLHPGRLVAEYNTFFGVLEPPPSLLYLVTANCCVRREPALAAGGFDETLKRPGGEDIVLSYRLWKAGWRFGRAEDAVVRHDYDRGLRAFYKTWWNYGFGSGYVNEAIIAADGPCEAPDGEPRWEPAVLAPYRPAWRALAVDVWSVAKAGRARGRSLVLSVGFGVLRILVLTAYARGYARGQAEARKTLADQTNGGEGPC